MGKDLTRSVYLVDTENVCDWWIGQIKSNTVNDRLFLFYSSNSGGVRFGKLEKLFETFPLKQIEVIETYPGPNSQDFFIVHELGKLITKAPNSKYYVVSHDTGYDPLLYKLHQDGYKTFRLDLDRSTLMPPVIPGREQYDRIVLNTPNSVPNLQPQTPLISKAESVFPNEIQKVREPQTEADSVKAYLERFCRKHQVPESLIPLVVKTTKKYWPNQKKILQQISIQLQGQNVGTWRGNEKNARIADFMRDAKKSLFQDLNKLYTPKGEIHA